ncbi:MAG TPA: hypothetical protein VK137_06575 [Planctomycetaceae bacterium]|nr:hypothetical protein [Planctomycetaceae bacterium]
MPVRRVTKTQSGKSAQPPQRLLDVWRLYGVHFPDVHLGNIRVRK